MLSQHLITKPVFEALFGSHSFVNNNPVSQSMENILNVLDKQGLVKEQQQLEGFYESVRIRAEGIDNLEAKQNIIEQLYEKFFKIGFKDTTEQLGIVFTPTEVVDFIIQSVEDVLKNHFNKSLKDEQIHVLDPFTGTGTFIARLLQSGLIPKEDLVRKYTQELHANEIVLLSYYIAAINIEETFHSLIDEQYQPFEGIVLTDTFESNEKEDSFENELFNENNDRLIKQQSESITAIIGNPPYSVGSKDENISTKNQKYPKLDYQISNTYAKHSSSKSIRGLYDSYIKAFRWATDRIDDKGVVGFITNSSYLDSTSTDGLRKSFYEEYNYIYIFNLRGGIRGRIGDDAKKEGENIFDIMTGVSICILVKDSSNTHEIKYFDIGDYLSKKEKLKKISELKSINAIDWNNIEPNNYHDWINKRNEIYGTFDALLSDIFHFKVDGIQTNRDSWIYGFSLNKVKYNSKKLIENYNTEKERLKGYRHQDKLNYINTDNSYMSWSRSLKKKLQDGKSIDFIPNQARISMYRPFVRKYVYYQKEIVEYPRNFEDVFSDNNLIISVTGLGSKKEFSTLMIDSIPNYDMIEKGRHFILKLNNSGDFDLVESNGYNITDKFQKKIGLNEYDTFFYIYGILHSKDYRFNYQNDLRKELPRIPVVKDKQKVVEIGKKLSDLHLNYESVAPYNSIKIEYKKNNPSYRVEKMKHPKRNQIDTITFNNDIIITNIPEKAYEYVINGKPAIKWIMEQYQIKRDNKTGIIDDPNDFSEDEKYIFNLLLSIINVSIKTVDLVNSLPPLEIEE